MGNINFFLDSGAFSADSQNKPVSLGDYIAFIKEHEESIDIYPVLDVIGCAEKTWENQYEMEKQGLVPMPVFHVEDDVKYLDKCLTYDYFCLGGMAGGASSKSRQHFLNKCFTTICDTPDNTPISKVHGFGLASPSLMTAYPFYSVDTSSWVSYSQFGIILLPKKNYKGEWLYGETPIKIFVTARSPKNAMEGLHYNNLSAMDKAAVLCYVNKMGFQMGSSVTFDCGPDYELQDAETFINKEKTLAERVISEGISNDNSLRYSYNMKYFQAIADSCPKYPWAWTPTIRSFF
jgi:hypothetical protein